MPSYSTDFKILSTNHIIISAKVNNIKGNFIIDTGASNSCIDFKKRSKYKLNFKISELKAASATTQINEIFSSNNNIIEIAKLKKK